MGRDQAHAKLEDLLASGVDCDRVAIASCGPLGMTVSFLAGPVTVSEIAGPLVHACERFLEAAERGDPAGMYEATMLMHRAKPAINEDLEVARNHRVH